MSRNPYSPRGAPVAAGENAPGRPRTVVAAVAALWTWVALSAPLFAIAVFGAVAPLGLVVVQVTLTVAALAIGALFFNVVTLAIARGYKWARISLVAVFLTSMPGSIEHLRLAVENPLSIYSAVVLILDALQIAFVVLVFTPSANRWFARLPWFRRQPAANDDRPAS